MQVRASTVHHNTCAILGIHGRKHCSMTIILMRKHLMSGW